MANIIFIYLLGSFLSFILLLGSYYEKYYSPYNEPEIDILFQEHPEAKINFIFAAASSWLFIAFFVFSKIYLWLENKLK